MLNEARVALGFLLDGEQRRRVQDCLTKGGVKISANKVEGLARAIEKSIALFVSRPTEDTFREAHDQLAQLWEMSHDNDPQARLIRGRVRRLPETAVEYLDRRWLRISSSLFPGEPRAERFQDWAQTASKTQLIKALQVVTAEGAKVITGRSRGGTRRSAARVAPIVMGVARGTGSQIRRGGRPRNDERKTLVMHLALDWLDATDSMPTAGRDGCGGFSDLVHSVFQWLPLPRKAAVYALRQYWADVTAGQKRR